MSVRHSPPTTAKTAHNATPIPILTNKTMLTMLTSTPKQTYKAGPACSKVPTGKRTCPDVEDAVNDDAINVDGDSSPAIEPTKRQKHLKETEENKEYYQEFFDSTEATLNIILEKLIDLQNENKELRKRNEDLFEQLKSEQKTTKDEILLKLDSMDSRMKTTLGKMMTMDESFQKHLKKQTSQTTEANKNTKENNTTELLEELKKTEQDFLVKNRKLKQTLNNNLNKHSNDNLRAPCEEGEYRRMQSFRNITEDWYPSSQVLEKHITQKRMITEGHHIEIHYKQTKIPRAEWNELTEKLRTTHRETNIVLELKDLQHHLQKISKIQEVMDSQTISSFAAAKAWKQVARGNSDLSDRNIYNKGRYQRPTNHRQTRTEPEQQPANEARGEGTKENTEQNKQKQSGRRGAQERQNINETEEEQRRRVRQEEGRERDFPPFNPEEETGRDYRTNKYYNRRGDYNREPNYRYNYGRTDRRPETYTYRNRRQYGRRYDEYENVDSLNYN